MNSIVTKRLRDALEAAKYVQQWTQGQSFDTYVTDPIMRYPVERQLEIIGVALGYAQKGGLNIRDEALDIERWKHFLPAYDQIDNWAIWNTATQEVPELIGTLERILAAKNT